MLLEDIEVGDVLQIRQYEDMVEEYGRDEDGDILVTEYDDDDNNAMLFLKSMKYLCGKIFTVKQIDYDDNHRLYSHENVEEAPRWTITAGMLERVRAPIEPFTDDNLNELLGF